MTLSDADEQSASLRVPMSDPVILCLSLRSAARDFTRTELGAATNPLNHPYDKGADIGVEPDLTVTKALSTVGPCSVAKFMH